MTVKNDDNNNINFIQPHPYDAERPKIIIISIADERNLD